MAVNGVSEQLTDMISKFAYVRTGIVTVVDPQFATVTVGETSIRAAYIRQAEPGVGDVVGIVRQGASWLVLGTSSVSGGNAVLNASFEQTGAGLTPPQWTLYDIASTSTAVDAADPKAVPDVTTTGEPRLLEVAPRTAGTATSFTYSNPIGVDDGQIWDVSAYVWATYAPGSTADTSDAGLTALWFGDAVSLYPATSNADTVIVATADVVGSTVPVVKRGTVTVPVGAAFMRVALRSNVGAYSTLQYDAVTARRVS